MKRTPLRRYTGFRPTKFGNKWSSYKNELYQSKAERNYAMFLDSEKRKGRIKEWIRQVNVHLVVNNKKICEAICDFLITFPDGHQEFHEVKGFKTDVFRFKEKLFRALYPNKQLKIIKV